MRFPKQKLTTAQKTKTWAKESVDSLIARSTSNWNNRKKRIMRLLDMYYGAIQDEDYMHLLQPYGKEREHWPFKIKNYPIVSTKVDRLLSEYRKRANKFQVICTNSDASSLKQEELNSLINKSFEQKFINRMNELGINTQVPSQEVQMPHVISDLFEASYKDKRAIRGQRALNYIWQNCELDRKHAKGFQWWLITGEAYSKRDVCYNDVEQTLCSPLQIDYDKDPNIDFVEDGSWVVYRDYCTVSSIIDKYHKELKPADIDKLENGDLATKDALDYSSWMANNPYMASIQAPFSSAEVYIPVTHVTWKSFKKVGIVTYVDEFGDIQQEYVDDTYVPGDKSEESIEWEWISEWWESTKIGSDIYILTRPVPVQRDYFGNISKNKCPYNGRAFNNLNYKPMSLVERGYTYQTDYNEARYRLNSSIAKAKDVMALLNLDLIPKKWGNDIDKWLEYGEKSGILFVDYSKEGLKLNAQHQNILDLTNKSIQNYIETCRFIRDEWDSVSGISRQMEGNITQQDEVGTTNQAILQSSLIVEEYFAEYAELVERDLQALLDLSKIAWVGSKKSIYITGDLDEGMFEIDGDEHAESEYGVFVLDSMKYNTKLELIRQQVQHFIQNGTKASVIADMIDSDNISIIKMKMKAAEKAEEDLNRAMEEYKAQQAKELQAQAEAHENKLLDRAEMSKQLDRENKLQVAEINSLGRASMTPQSDDSSIIEEASLSLEQSKHAFDANFRLNELRLKNKELKVKEKDIASKEKMAKEKNENDLKIAKENKTAAEIKSKKSK